MCRTQVRMACVLFNSGERNDRIQAQHPRKQQKGCSLFQFGPFLFSLFFSLFIATVITEPPARSTHDLPGALLSLFGGLNLLSVDEKYDEAEEGKTGM